MKTKLLNIQAGLNVPKTIYNKFGEFYYRSTEQILEAVKPLLIKEGLMLLLTDEIINLGERYYIKATAILSDGTNEIKTTAYAREHLPKSKMDESQLTGSASSYARKYALNGLFLIDDTKDPDFYENKTERKTAGLTIADLVARVNKAKVEDLDGIEKKVEAMTLTDAQRRIITNTINARKNEIK